MPNSMNVERQAVRVLESFLREIPRLDLNHIDREPPSASGARVDIIAEARYAGRPVRLIVEVKANGQPRVMRDAALQLKHYSEHRKDKVIPVVMAPYLSEQARDICKAERVGYIDFLGNAHIAFDTIYIDRQVEGRPEPERRALRSLFKPKSARILRSLLRKPGRSWRVAELAEAAHVSVGLVSTVGAVLRERGWGEQTERGLVLDDPGNLLDTWSEEYMPPPGDEVRLYTHLHGTALTEKLKGVLNERGRVALASFSAADWLAPYVRSGTTYFYADEKGLGAIQTRLGSASTPKGANIVVRIPDEDGVLDDAVPVAEGIIATSPVQTYLDLMKAGERGREGAEHLRSLLLDWSR